MDFYLIICTPFDGYGERYVWSAHHTYDNAKAEMEKLVKKYNLEQSGFFADKYYNYDNPSIKNRFYRFEIESMFFDD